MYMWEPYVQATLEAVPLPRERIVFDRFRTMQHISRVADTVRKRDHRGRLQDRDKRLKGTKYLWLPSKDNVCDSRRPFFEQPQASERKTARAWGITENPRNLWSYTIPGCAKRFFNRWRNWAVLSRLAPLVAFARMISRKLDNAISYHHHPVTNAVAEGLNSKIMTIKRRPGSFRNIEYYKTVIFFHAGELRL